MQHRSEIRGQLLGVLMRIEDRITFDQAKLIRGVIDVDEWGVALEQSADVLSENEVGLRDERNHFPDAERRSSPDHSAKRKGSSCGCPRRPLRGENLATHIAATYKPGAEPARAAGHARNHRRRPRRVRRADDADALGAPPA